MFAYSHQRRELLLGLLGALGMAGCRPSYPTRAPSTEPSVPRVDLRVSSLNRLRQIGLAYRIAAIQGRVTGPESLGQDIQMNDPRGRPYEIVWRFDPNATIGNDSHALLAWEKEPDEQNGRCVLRADCNTVEHISDEKFKKAPRAQPRR
jgi:hypothetical protein